MTDKTTVLTIESTPTENLPVTQNDQSSLMMIISKLAQDPDPNAIERLEQLIKLRNAEIAAQAKREFDADFVAMKPHLPLVAKTHDNSQTKSKYAKLEDINKVVDPILAKHGFGTTDRVIAQTAEDVTMLIELRHRGGHSESMTLTMPIDDRGAQGTVNKTKPHAISSTIMYIRRVGKCALIGISTGDDKDGNQDSEQITVEQAAALDTRLRAISDKALPNFLKWAKVDSMIDISAKFYPAAVKAVANMEQEANKVKS